MLQNLLNNPVQPFRATPDSRFYYNHPSIESARQTLLRAVIRSEGPVVVLGGSGYGKSLLAEVIADQLCQRLDVAMLQSARLRNRRALLQSILFELKLPYLDLSEGELRLSILDRLEPSPETAPEGVLIVVDEAHTLHWKLLDELRLITNFSRNHQPRVKLALFGNMQLEETLASPQLDSFNQRLAARCYLQPMSRSETSNYIQHQLRECGIDPATVITQEALSAVFSASDGIPRLVNQLMDHSIWLACSNAQSPISASLIDDAWRDLQQLPTPWSSGKEDASPTSVTIEYGALADDDDDHDDLTLAPDSLSRFLKGTHPNTDAEPVTSYFDYSAPAESETESDVNSACSPECELQLNDEQLAALHIVADQSEVHCPTQCSELTSEDQTAPLNCLNPVQLGVEGFRLDDDNNFFSAFQSTASSVFLKELAESTEDDSWRVQPAATRHYEIEVTLPQQAEQSINIPFPRVVAASQPDEGFVAGDSNSTVLGNDWFAPSDSGVGSSIPMTPLSASDNERIMNLVAEQQQYDAMGVWENDPPLSLQAEPAQSDQPIDRSENFFGDDFEEDLDLSIDKPSAAVRSERPRAVASSDAIEQTEQSMDYLQRIEKYAEALSSAAQAVNDNRMSEEICHQDNQSTKPCSQSGEFNELCQDQPVLDDSLWCIDVSCASATSQLDKPLEESIEDLVAQLNFSAFSTESFSVEQIQLDADYRSVPFDSVRRGTDNEVYMMHRPIIAMDSDPEPVDTISDDRDLLIIEEEIPVSMRNQTNNNADQPTQRTTSYSQLFTRLRK
jgi:type II secretory pathway predicted ATPase ExeA